MVTHTHIAVIPERDEQALRTQVVAGELLASLEIGCLTLTFEDLETLNQTVRLLLDAKQAMLQHYADVTEANDLQDLDD